MRQDLASRRVAVTLDFIPKQNARLKSVYENKSVFGVSAGASNRLRQSMRVAVLFRSSTPRMLGQPFCFQSDAFSV